KSATSIATTASTPTPSWPPPNRSRRAARSGICARWTSVDQQIASALGRALHRDLRLQAGAVAIDRGNGEHAPAAAIAQQAIARRDVALDRDVVPRLGMADIVDRHVVMLAPEERHLSE